MTNAERCQWYRENAKLRDAGFMERERLRQLHKRHNRTPEQRERDNETARERMRRYREKKKLEGSSTVKAKPVLTRKQTETQRQKWKEYKRKQR